MAQTQKQEFTLQQLMSMSKGEVKELAQSLHIKTQSLSKDQLMSKIIGRSGSVSSDVQELVEENTETDPLEMVEDTKLQPSPLQRLTTEVGQQLTDLKESVPQAQS